MAAKKKTVKKKARVGNDYTFKVTVSVDSRSLSGFRINKTTIQRMLREALNQYKDFSSGPVAAADHSLETLERIASGSKFKVNSLI